MRVVHLIARLNDGGPARVLAALAREFCHRGHQVRILAGSCGPGEPDLTPALVAAGIEVEAVPGLGRRLSPLDDLRAFWHLRSRLEESRPDLLHTHTAKAGALGRIAARHLGIPCLHTYHGHVLEGYFGPLGNLAVKLAERCAAGNAWHQALTPGQMLDLSVRFHVGRRWRWTWLPVPVDPVAPVRAAWHAALRHGLPVLGFLGRCAPVKDGHLWLAALAALARRHPVQGLICGDGVERPALESEAQRLGVPVHFAGQVPAGEALCAMDCLLMTSRNEGQPLSAIEAAGAGVPVVAPPVGGLADLVRWGAVEAAPRNPEGLAEAVQRLLDDPVARAARRVRAARVANRLTGPALAPLYESLYARVMGG